MVAEMKDFIQKMLALSAMCIALAGSIHIGQRVEKDNANFSAFQKWTPIFRNEPGRGI